MHFMYSLFLIKPASEGKKKEEHFCSSLRKKHPRSCGKNPIEVTPSGIVIETSPLMREKKEEHLCSSSAELCTSSHVTFTTFGWLPLPYSVHKQCIRFRCCQTTTISIARISETLNAVTALLSCSLLLFRFFETCKLSDKFQIRNER